MESIKLTKIPVNWRKFIETAGGTLIPSKILFFIFLDLLTDMLQVRGAEAHSNGENDCQQSDDITKTVVIPHEILELPKG